MNLDFRIIKLQKRSISLISLGKMTECWFFCPKRAFANFFLPNSLTHEVICRQIKNLSSNLIYTNYQKSIDVLSHQSSWSKFHKFKFIVFIKTSQCFRLLLLFFFLLHFFSLNYDKSNNIVSMLNLMVSFATSYDNPCFFFLFYSSCTNNKIVTHDTNFVTLINP